MNPQVKFSTWCLILRVISHYYPNWNWLCSRFQIPKSCKTTATNLYVPSKPESTFKILVHLVFPKSAAAAAHVAVESEVTVLSWLAVLLSFKREITETISSQPLTFSLQKPVGNLMAYQARDQKPAKQECLLLLVEFQPSLLGLDRSKNERKMHQKSPPPQVFINRRQANPEI